MKFTCAVPLCIHQAGAGRVGPEAVDCQRVSDKRAIAEPGKAVIRHVRAGEIPAARLLVGEQYGQTVPVKGMIL
jgi:hypothetical protein